MEIVKTETSESNISYLKGIDSQPAAVPRIGERYQAEIPDLMMTCNYANYPEKMAPHIPIFMSDPSSSEEECVTLPDIRAPKWNESEKEMFLAGIYIFGKRLNLVRRFLEVKNMGDVLRYYYGEFYKSDAHRKSKAKRCVTGSRIFSGWRQHEILTRLMESVSAGSRGQLLEIIKAYDQGETSFEDFIFSLKCVAGAHFLVQAIGIGKGKRDLTRIRWNPTTSRHQGRGSLAMPVGKGWPVFSSEEIMQLLSGRVRLGKARLRDIFWEAVWPRLLVRGWTSQKPTNKALIFLVPGIDNFTGENLILGIHYFNSITELLSKVASNPELILLDEESPLNPNENKNNSHLYLCPKLPVLNSDLLEYTIVDTSMVQGDGAFKIRALRSLPSDETASDVNALSIHSGKAQTNMSEIEDAWLQSKLKDCLVPLSKRRRLTACKQETNKCQMEKSKDSECDENGPLGSHYHDTNQEIWPKEVLKKEEMEQVADKNTDNEVLCGTNGRRHGTRIRPPTTKALESLALGFLGRKRRRRNNAMKSGTLT